MDKEFLISALKSIENAKRENRDRVANIVYNHKELFNYLVELTFNLKNTKEKVDLGHDF